VTTRRSTRIFFATDLHGSERCFRKFINASAFYDADLLVLGGDLVGKEMVFLRKRPAGYYEASEGERRVRMTTEGERTAFMHKHADQGAYAVLVDEAVDEPEQAAKLFERATLERLSNWMELARAKLSGTGTRLIMIPGNDDPLAVDQVLHSDEVVLNIDRRTVIVEPGLQFAGLGWSNPTPWQTAREYDDPTIAGELGRILATATHDLPLIFNVHVPPYGSGLDICPALDADLRPVIGPGGPLLASVGSQAVHDAVLHYRPVLGLFGHVHESRACATVGRSLCVNPGSHYSEGKLTGFLAEIQNGSVRNWMLTEG
jgi:uncharacterized protein